MTWLNGWSACWERLKEMSMDDDARILIIDDEEIIRIGCQRILEENYRTVEMAENGRLGWNRVSAKPFDLVLLDLMMPEMGGLEVLERIQKQDPDIVVIIITGFATIETAVDAMRKGAYDYLPKPFTPEELRTKVRRGLEKRRLILQARQLMQERDRNLLECANEKSRTMTIINCLSEGLIATNRTGHIVLMNPAAMNMVRPRTSPVIGSTVSGLLANPQLEKEIAETLERVTATATLTRLEINTTDKRVLQSHISPIMDDRGECLGTVTVLLDITQDKKVEKMKSDFVRLVSHELKSPVAAIAGYLNLIIDGLTAKNPDKEKEIILRSRDKANTLIEMINDLLDLSRADRNRPAVTQSQLNISEVLSETVKFYQNEARSKKIDLTLQLTAPLPLVMGDAEALGRVFANLIGNAIKYTPENGRVSVETGQRNGLLAVSVRDSGLGIAADELGKIFDEFYRCREVIDKKIAGTGLGLSIAKHIVEAHRGYMEVESEVHKGSVFRVLLPPADGAKEQNPA
jgi:two-component system, OmpR family, phosphate regulon sensor histidine kinase PhoR